MKDQRHRYFGLLDEKQRLHTMRDDGRLDRDWHPNRAERAFAAGLGIDFVPIGELADVAD